MAARNSSTGWGWVARGLHWVMAALILGMLGMGLYMSNFEKDLIAQYKLIQWHKSFGFTVFVLALLRVVWRLANPVPALPAGMPAWQVRASHLSHVALYVLIFVMPLTGWLMVSASPFNDPDAQPFHIPNMVFELFEMPDPYPTGSEALTATYKVAHVISAILLSLILLVHAAAALKHQFIDRDGLLARMIRG